MKKGSGKKQIQEQKEISVIKKKAWLEWSTALIIGIIGSVSAYYLVEYFMEPMRSNTLSYYYVLNTIPVTSEMIPNESVNKLSDMFSIVVKPDKPLNISQIRIHDVEKVTGYSVYCSENDVNQGISKKSKVQFNTDAGIVTISDLPTIPSKSKLIINVIGHIDSNKCNPVI